MKKRAGILVLAISGMVIVGGGLAATVTVPPRWAYPVNPPGDAPAKEDGSLRHVPGSNAAFTVTQTRDRFTVPDWHPEGHPKMPEVVARGRKPSLNACGYCHLPNGLGRPENASLAGLPADYIEQQVADFKSGARKSSQPKMTPPALMIDVAKAASEDEVRIAAEYFSNLKRTPWIRVEETETVPKTHISGSMLLPMKGGGVEPIGTRIIETPENLQRTELRDATSGFIAYMPKGSIKRGEAIVTAGPAGKATQCRTCHGPDLKGMGPVPPLAGRSPSYVVRQLVDIQTGARHGASSELMKPVVAKLTVSDMVAIAAYTASLKP